MTNHSARAESVRVGVLSLHNSKETKAICNAVEDLGHEPVWIRGENLQLDAGYGNVSPTPEPDVLINRLLLHSEMVGNPLDALGLLRSYESANIPIVNPADAVITATHKFASLSRLAAEGYPIPPSTLGISAERISDLEIPKQTLAGDGGATTDLIEPKHDQFDAAVDSTDERVVFKQPIGTHGDETQLVEDDGDIPSLATGGQGILQPMITTPDGDHEDFRVYVVGDECLGVMRRHAPNDDWRTNVANGGRVRDATADIPAHVTNLAIDVTDALGLDVAGVDIIEGTNGWYVLEVNATAGFKGFFEATGHNPAPYVAALAIERAGGNVDEQTVERIAVTLDDSVPDCKPPRRPSPEPKEAVVGYTTKVRVAGQRCGERVVAKSDTGATRTSIDIELASRIGAGPMIESTNIKETTEKRPVVPVSIYIDGYTHEIEANVRDRSRLNHDLLLGRDILQHYSVRVAHCHGKGAPACDASEE